MSLRIASTASPVQDRHPGPQASRLPAPRSVTAWIVAFEKKLEEAKGLKDDITGRDSYKKNMSRTTVSLSYDVDPPGRSSANAPP